MTNSEFRIIQEAYTRMLCEASEEMKATMLNILRKFFIGTDFDFSKPIKWGRELMRMDSEQPGLFNKIRDEYNTARKGGGNDMLAKEAYAIGLLLKKVGFAKWLDSRTDEQKKSLYGRMKWNRDLKHSEMTDEERESERAYYRKRYHDNHEENLRKAREKRASMTPEERNAPWHKWWESRSDEEKAACAARRSELRKIRIAKEKSKDVANKKQIVLTQYLPYVKELKRFSEIPTSISRTRKDIRQRSTAWRRSIPQNTRNS